LQVQITSQVTMIFFRSLHTSSRPMFTTVLRIPCLPESSPICSKNGKQYQIAVSYLPSPPPNSITANPASTPEEFPPTRSRVVIRLAQDTKAKPNANTRTLRPDKCLVVSSLTPALRPGCPRNTGANAVTTRIIYPRPAIGVVRALAPATDNAPTGKPLR
jgi:hypothetical protein